MYLGKKEIYCVFKACCIICVLFSTKCRLLHNFIFFCSNNIFFVNCALKYQPSHLKVKCGMPRGESVQTGPEGQWGTLPVTVYLVLTQAVQTVTAACQFVYWHSQCKPLLLHVSLFTDTVSANYCCCMSVHVLTLSVHTVAAVCQFPLL
jgi:hypothetical protein